MTVYAIGVPVNTHAAAGSVTGTWGTGQTRAAGNLLLAVVTAGATTSVAATATVTGGWVNLFEQPNSGTANVRTAMWAKPAAGADAAPVFTSAVVGTGAMDCMLFELPGAYTVTPVDTSGVYASGAAAGTLSLMTATTAAHPAIQGELAISVFAQQAAAGNLTWADASLGVSGFAKVLNGNGVSSVLQTYVGLVNPPSGAVVPDSGAFSTNTSAFGAGIVAVFSCNLPEQEMFANNAAGTVTAGGTGAPAAGTGESWTVNVTSGFPVAVPNATIFHVVDPLVPSEKFAVTVAPGGVGSSQAWTVIRGAEGTTPVTHSAGFVITQAVTAGVLTVMQRPGEYSVKDYGAIGNGVADDAPAINAIIAQAPQGSKVIFPYGVYGVGSTLQMPGGVTYEGWNKDSCIIMALSGANLDAVAATAGWTDSTNINAVTSSVVTGIQFQGQPAQASGQGHGLVLQTYRCRVRDCVFYNCKGDGLRLDQRGLNGTTGIGNAMEENKIWDCQFDSCTGNGFHVNDPTQSTITDGFLLSCVIRYSLAENVNISTSAGWLLDGNHSYQSGFSAYRCDRPYQTRIVNNYVESWGGSATSGTYGGIDCSTGLVADGGNGSVIANNVIRFNVAAGNAASFIDGISFRVVTGQTGNVSIVGNNLFTAQAAAGKFNGINLTCQGAGSTLNTALTGNLILGTTWDNKILQTPNGGTITVITES